MSGIMAVEINEETKVIVEVPIPIRLPKWLWIVLFSRAKEVHGSDLEALVNQLVNVGIEKHLKCIGVNLSIIGG